MDSDDSQSYSSSVSSSFESADETALADCAGTQPYLFEPYDFQMTFSLPSPSCLLKLPIREFKINDATAATTPHICILNCEKQKFCTPFTCLFQFRAFLSSSRQICDVK